MSVAWLSTQLICSECMVLRMLVERQWDYTVVSQQFAGIEETFYSLVVQTGINACGGRGWVYGRCWVYKRRVYGRCRVYGRERFVSGRWTCRNTRGSWWLVWSLVVTREIVWWHGSSTGGDKRPLTTLEFDRWPEETVTSSQSVLLPGELGSSRQSDRFGSSSTVSPADVTDNRPPWRTYFESYICFYYSFIFVISVVVSIFKKYFPSSKFRCLFF